jgi:glycosyltransferase involved in cell wall biosynthesis
MHLLGVIYSLGAGGAERVIVSLANHWADRGWRVTLVTLAGCDRDFYRLHSGVRRIALGVDGESRNMAAAVAHNLRRVYALRKVLRQEQPDVAFGMMSTASCLLALAASRTGIPALGTERSWPPKMTIGRIWWWMRRITYPWLDAVVAPTAQGARWLERHAGVRRAQVIPNPVTYPVPAGEPKVSPAVIRDGSGAGLLLAVGRLSPEKGFDRLLTAFARLAPRFPGWRLAIVGEGPLRPVLESQATALRLKERVCFPGVVGNIGDWYRSASLYVLVSHFEGFPNTLCEAMAYGLPAVSVDCATGPRDILSDGVNGLLVPQNDINALTSALARLLGDASLRRRLGAGALEVRERLALDRISGEWEKLFAELVSNAR